MQKPEPAIRNIPDFPRVGIQFKDITPLLADGTAFREAIDALKGRHEETGIHADAFRPALPIHSLIQY